MSQQQHGSQPTALARHQWPAKLVGRRLRAERIARGWSLRRFATEVEISPTFASLLERGSANPSLETLRRLSTVLEVSLDALTGRGLVPPGPRPPSRRSLPLELHLETYSPADRLTEIDRGERGGPTLGLVLSGTLRNDRTEGHPEYSHGDSINPEEQSLTQLRVSDDSPATVVWATLDDHLRLIHAQET
jgi:transcriptional regulator with XRE-family HTH domain